MNGYWKFHRAMYEHPIWKRPMATRLVWITILGYANFTEKEWLYKGTLVAIPSGTWITTQDHLAELSGVSRKQVRNAIKDLIALESIRANQRANRYTEICVVNWPIYQSNELNEGQPKGQERANQGPTKGQDVRREEGKEVIPVGFDVFWSHYFPRRRVAKQGALKAWKILKPTQELQAHILSALSKQSDRYSLVEDAKIPHAATWLNGRRWEDEIPSNGTGKAKAPDPYAGQSTAWKCVQCGGVHESRPGGPRTCPLESLRSP